MFVKATRAYVIDNTAEVKTGSIVFAVRHVESIRPRNNLKLRDGSKTRTTVTLSSGVEYDLMEKFSVICEAVEAASSDQIVDVTSGD